MRVLICAGGVIGASIAYFLSRRGVRSVVIERTGLACAASGKSGRNRTMSDVFVVALCVIGKNTAASGSSLSEKYFPSATTPTIRIERPDRFLK